VETGEPLVDVFAGGREPARSHPRAPPADQVAAVVDPRRGSGARPNFLIIGAPKAGTTALYHYLKQHPQIYMSPVKEPGFFDNSPERARYSGPGDQTLYRTAVTSLPAYEDLFRQRRDEIAIGEASPYYLYSPLAANRIRSLIPGAKLIAILRNPIDRAYSAFLHNLSDGREPLTSFAAALADEDAGRRQGFSPFWYYKRGGFYHRYLTPYLEDFGAKQLRIYLYDDFTASPHRTLQDMFRFLEVDDAFVADVSLRYNVSGVPRIKGVQGMLNAQGSIKSAIKALLPSGLRYGLRTRLRARNLVKPPLPDDVRARLACEYRDDVLELSALIDRDLSIWLR
jgi:hypothetical protein